MFNIPAYAYQLAVKLASQPRFTGSEGEERARELLTDELHAAGYDVRLEEFKVKLYRVEKAELEVTSPSRKIVECSPVGFSGETPEDGVEGELVYVEKGDPALVPKEDGWIGLASARPGRKEWKKLAGKAAGLVVAENSPYRKLSRVGVPWEWREKLGNLPAVYVSYRQGVELLAAERVKLTLLQEYFDAASFNIVAEKRGWKYPEEVVYVTAHFDSQRGVAGAIDNAAGTALAVAIAKSLAGAKLRRTLRFALFSGEELGLRGSLAHVEKLGKEADKVVLVVNLDVHGAALGSSSAVVTGSKSLRYAVEYVAKRLGVSLAITEDVMSSDSASFARRGVPAVNFFRSSGAGHGLHTVDDAVSLLHPRAFDLVGRLALEFVKEIADAEEVPFEREVPQEVKKKVEEYFKERLGIG